MLRTIQAQIPIRTLLECIEATTKMDGILPTEQKNQ